MADPNPRFEELNEKLEILLRQHEQFQKEIEQLRSAIELERLKGSLNSGLRNKQPTVQGNEGPVVSADATARPVPKGKRSKKPAGRSFRLKDLLDNRIEKFIGENLANKIGILIVVIGVTIGVKYIIDKQLISPLLRIILGYASGLVLLGFSYRLKRQYHGFSAVLLSGAMAILYFITFAAHEFYGFFGPLPAFLLLVAITAFTVFEATRFDQQIIALLGLVGAYAVPFLVGKDTGQALVLFTYVAIINAGVLIVAVQRYWKPLYYAAFLLTWLIFLTWYLEDYSPAADFRLGMVFSALFFGIFYVTFLAYKLIKGQKFRLDDVALLLINAFIFFVFGYLMLGDIQGGQDYQGAFAAGNAVIHFAISWFIQRFRNADHDLYLLIAGLALVFITIAIPVQFDGRAVTIFWAAEATLLFWLGRSRQAKVYELLSYPVMLLAFGSILNDWGSFYDQNLSSTGLSVLPSPFFNLQLLTSLLVTVAFGSMTMLNYRQSAAVVGKLGQTLLSYFLPIAFFILLFFAFWQEIGYYWQLKVLALNVEEGGQAERLQAADFMHISSAWKVNYSLLFFTGLAFFNSLWLKDQMLGLINLSLNFMVLMAFLTIGLYELNSLWDSFYDRAASAYYSPGAFHLWFRYLSYVFVGMLLLANSAYLKRMPALANMKVLVELFFFLTVLWILSSELVHWLEVMGGGASDRLGLSILWGVYAFLLVGLGIWRKKTHLRIAAMVLFAVTLGKLFFYDLVDLDNVSKTIIFVSLGSLLLIISFLYNKYRHTIFEEPEDS